VYKGLVSLVPLFGLNLGASGESQTVRQLVFILVAFPGFPPSRTTCFEIPESGPLS
jgi:hypothetical protein